MNENQTAVLQFLTELRKRFLYCVLSIAIIFLILLHFANSLYFLLASPLLKQLPKNHGFIATNVMSSFFVPIDFTLVISAFLAIPILLYHTWAFVTPALYSHEKRKIWPLLLISTFLFYLGIAFAYFIIFPILFAFLTHTAPNGVTLSPDIELYLHLTLKLFFIFGLMFELPVLIVLFVWTGFLTRKQLIRFRPFAIVLAFILGMLLAPPDVLSQILFSVPLWVLFELGILFSYLILKAK